MRILYVLMLPLFLCATEVGKLKLNESIPIETLKDSVPSNFIVTDDVIKDDYSRKLFFAKMYLKEMTETEKLSLDFSIITLLNNLEIKKILDKEALKINDDISYSYYLANKNKYIIPASITLHILTFKTKKDADTYDINKKLPKPKTKKTYKKFEIESLSPNYVLALQNLDSKTLTQTYKVKDKYIRVYYTDKKEISYRPYNQVKKSIVDYLLNQKQRDFLDEFYKKRK